MRALQIGTLNYGAVKSILDNRLGGQPVRRAREGEDEGLPITHPNIRGSGFYH